MLASCSNWPTYSGVSATGTLGPSACSNGRGSARSFDSDVDGETPVGGVRGERKPSESTLVIRALYRAIADGTLHAGRKLSERSLAARVQLSSGAVSDALRQLAEDGLVNQDDTGHFFVPAPTERDVLETYTARGLLGTAIVRRLASRAHPLPEAVDDVFNELIRCVRQDHLAATDSLDLDVQDELARAAEMPRIEAMFVRLTLQLRLFVPLMGLHTSTRSTESSPTTPESSTRSELTTPTPPSPPGEARPTTAPAT